MENKEKRVNRIEIIKFLGYEISLNTVKLSLDRTRVLATIEAREQRKTSEFCGFDQLR